jgi:hypothetical protein
LKSTLAAGAAAHSGAADTKKNNGRIGVYLIPPLARCQAAKRFTGFTGTLWRSYTAAIVMLLLSRTMIRRFLALYLLLSGVLMGMAIWTLNGE